MAVTDLVRGTNLGAEFDLGIIEAGKVRLKIGSGLSRAGDGTISATGGGGGTPFTLYDYWTTWAEENASMAAGQDEWSWGNGATGRIGIALPIGNGQAWELIEMGFHADSASGTVDMAVTNLGTTVNAAGGTIINTQQFSATGPAQVDVSASGATAAGGTVLGFHTEAMAGAFSDGRVWCLWRQPIATISGTLV